MLRNLASLSATVLLLGFGLAQANASPMGPVSSGVFTAAGLNQNDYSYVGASTSDFTSHGTGTLTLASSTFFDSVGLASAPSSNPRQTSLLFTNQSAIGSTATINPSFNPFAFYFKTSGGGSGPGADLPATLYSDGVGNTTDNGQAELAIYYDASASTYALFFDDGGPAGISAGHPVDDNDYNDLVVTYKQAATPEPASLALFGTGLLGVVGAVRRRLA